MRVRRCRSDSLNRVMKAKFLVPLVLFLVLAGFLGLLTLNPRLVPSPLIDKPGARVSPAAT